MAVADVKALTFDVFGTVVDWRGSVSREIAALSADRGLDLDADLFADEWRAGYGPGMNKVRTGEWPWIGIDGVHRRRLDELLVRFGVDGLTEQEIDHLNRVWHRLDPWPEAVEGLTRLKSRYIISTLSNGSVALLTNMAKRAGLPWDCVLSSELSGHYKPDPESYLKAAELLGLEPNEVMMTAAHPGDLRASAAVGLHTAFVRRPDEQGHGTGLANKPDLESDPSFDFTASSFNDLADQLGC
ncbi:MAG: haloacid dehalogenase type II [Chloroflexi bacterium]|nr:haloacid dehalogenase type II [Chloroflexota bacterium]